MDGELPAEELWPSALVVCGERPAFVKSVGAARMTDGDEVQRYMAWDASNLASIAASVGAARENARSIRDVVSLELWETVNGLYLWVQDPATRSAFEHDRFAFYPRIIDTVQLGHGVLRSTMLHDTPLDFILVGTLLERAGQMARTLDVHHHALAHVAEKRDGYESALWLSLLKTCSGLDPFMRLYQGRFGNDNVPAFLVLEPRFPRSIVHCLENARSRLLRMRPPSGPQWGTLERLEALIDRVQTSTRLAVGQGTLHELFTRVVEQTALVCEDLGHEMLGHDHPHASVSAQMQ